MIKYFLILNIFRLSNHKQRQQITLSPDEHSEYFWCPFSKVKELLAFSNQKETLMHIEEYYVKKKPNEASLVIL